MSVTSATRAVWPFVAVVAATKAADAVTTYLGLEVAVGVHEANPVVASTVAAHGTLPALAAVTLTVVCAVAVVTETAVAALSRYTDASAESRLAVRLVGYGLPSVVHVAVSARNAAVLAGL